jgi:F0F1-type ATP synthase membrane subunit b/b'
MSGVINESMIVAVAFCLFVPLVFKYVKKALVSILDERTKNIIKSLKESEKLFNEAQKLLSNAKLQYKEAEKMSKNIMIKAEEEVVMLINNAKKEAEIITKKKTDLSIARINQKENQLIEDIKLSAIQMAITKVEESLIKELDKEAQLSLLNDGLKQVRRLMN